MKGYIKIRLETLRNKPIEEQTRILKAIYNEGEERGYHHTLIFGWVNEIICENLRRLRSELE